MPIAKIQLPDGRIARFEVPEGTTPEQVTAYAEQMMGQPQGRGASGQFGSGASGKWHDSEAEYMVDQMGQPERFVTGIGKGMTDVGQGIKQIGLQAGESVGLVPRGRTAEYTRQIKSDEQQFDQPLLNTTEGKVGRFAGQMAATLPVSLPFGGHAATVGGRALQGAGIGALSSGVMPVEEGGSRLQNALIGAGIGGGMGALTAAGGKGYRALRGDNKTAVTGPLADLSDEFKVPLTVGELRGSPGLQRTEQMLERVPLVGTAGFRQKQGKALSDAAQKLAGKYSGVSDVGEELQGSLARTLAKNKALAAELYDQVGEAAAKQGGTVTLGNFRRTISELAQREGGLPDAIKDPQILAAIQKYGSLQDMPFDVARTVRSRLGKEVARVKKQAVSGTVSDEQAAAVQRIFSSLVSDIDDYAVKSGGRLSQTYRAADEFYKANVVPFKDRTMRKIADDTFDTDQIVKMFIKGDRPKLAARLMQGLDNRGKQALRAAILQDTLEGATIQQGGTTIFSPARFAQRIEKLGTTAQTVFPPNELRQLQGFAKLARVAQRAGQYAENPPTGMRVIDTAIMGGGAVGAITKPGTTLTAASMAGMLSKLLTTDIGRALLTRAEKIPANSQAFNRLVTKELPRVLALSERQINAKGKTLQEQAESSSRGY